MRIIAVRPWRRPEDSPQCLVVSPKFLDWVMLFVCVDIRWGECRGLGVIWATSGKKAIGFGWNAVTVSATFAQRRSDNRN